MSTKRRRAGLKKILQEIQWKRLGATAGVLKERYSLPKIVYTRNVLNKTNFSQDLCLLKFVAAGRTEKQPYLSSAFLFACRLQRIYYCKT